MSRLDGETKRKLREMNAGELLKAIDTQDETLSMGLPIEDRVRLVVDDAYSTFTHSKVAGLIRWAERRFPTRSHFSEAPRPGAADGDGAAVMDAVVADPPVVAITAATGGAAVCSRLAATPFSGYLTRECLWRDHDLD
ncbi:hypothetical protein [Glaciibacter superstes]|uniref:hypothetical protein n=1 Tax=Glaciibacter superstes TaxID=501023 RepID=UPI0003B30B9F|nr:hypothetical protein [Glaciibacter superstes]